MSLSVPLGPSEKLAILTRAAALLSASTHFESMVSQTIAACLPSLGDFGYFELRFDSDEVVRTSSAHQDERIAEILRRTQWARSERTDLNVCALSTGQPAFHTAIDDAWYRGIALNEGHLELLRLLAFRSMLTVPLRFGQEVIGALTLFFGTSGRQHDEAHLSFAQELAAIVAPIIVNARLVKRQSRAEEALRVSEERLRLATEAGQLGIWDWNISSDRIVWSDRVYELHGIDREKFGGRVEDFAALVHPEDRGRVGRAIETALQQADTYEVEFRILIGDSTRWLATRANVIRDPAGAPVRMVGATYDITARVDLLTAERTGRQRLEILARAGELLSSSLDRETILTAITSALAPQLADWCRIDLIDDAGELQHAISHHENAELARRGAELSRAYRGPATSPGTVGWVAANGQPFAAIFDDAMLANIPHQAMALFLIEGRLRSILSVPLVARDRTIGVLTVLRDDRRAVQLSMADAPLLTELANRAALALDNARLYFEAERARRAAETADRAKDEFLAVLGHELRNPLAPIVSALSLMESRAPDTSRREREVIGRQVSHLSRLVDDLLDVSRIVSGKVELARERLDLRAIISRAVEMTRPLFAGKEQALEIEAVAEPMWVRGDADRLAQIVSNLLTNAAKFSPPAGRVLVAMSTRNGLHELVVRDWGRGIAAALLPRVFDLFVQGQQAIDRRQGGLGLGLAIVSNLVGLHGGRVRAQSEGPGQGATFTVELPDAGSAHSTLTPAPRGAQARLNGRILIVDDNFDAADLLADLLRHAGLEVTVEVHPHAALETARRMVPEFAILDIGLPSMDGYELARQLRSFPELTGLRLIALTGYGRASDRARSKEAGFDHHLVKPVVPEALLALLDGLLVSATRDR